MQKEIKELFPSWCEENSVKKYDCIMSDDLDSLMCAVVQEKVFKNKVKYFFFSDNKSRNTQKCYKVKDHEAASERMLGLDIALEGNYKCWDNHVVKVSQDDIVNKNSANLNIALDIYRTNYTKKACVSSFITMLSYYDVDISNWSKEKLLVLCAIDGLYYPFQNTYFEKQGKKNLSILGYEFLVDFIKENISDIKKIKDKLRLDSKIWVNKEGKLETNIKLDELSQIFGFEIKLSDEIFIETKTLTKNFDRMPKETLLEKLKRENKALFNLALVKKDFYVYSYF